ncbi:MAG TPA: DUF5916 domain-containing protein [Terriglobales bacterium]
MLTSGRNRCLLWLIAVPYLAALACFASDEPARPIPGSPAVNVHLNSASIPRLTHPPVLEDFANMQPESDAARQMAKVSNFTQQQPKDGSPPSQKTDAYFGYDDKNLYIAAVCFDTEPDKIRSHLTRREQMIDDDDWIEITLDTFHDQRRGFLFTTNPAGVQADALWTENNGPDFSFDTVWNSQAKLTAQGYIVLFEIPFRSLRFPRNSAYMASASAAVRAGEMVQRPRSSAEQTWGITLLRNIPRLSESDYWPYVSSRISGRLNQEGTLSGFNGISPSRNMQFNPYGLFHSFRAIDDRDSINPRFTRRTAQFTGGLDSKFVFHDSLVLDTTINPDFSQIESDSPQQTVNQRFEVFFPEKRPFFLENSNYFSSVFSNLVFTRRIADPEYGIRLTGKLGSNNLGLLLTDDRSPGEIVPPGDPLSHKRAYFAIGRFSHDLGKQSSIGVIYTDREFHGSFNRIGGPDMRLRLTDKYIINAQIVESSTQNLDGTYQAGPATKILLEGHGRKFNHQFEYDDISPNFITESGFINRVDQRRIFQFLNYRFRPEGKHFISWGPNTIVERLWGHDGTLLSYHYELNVPFNFRRQTDFGPILGVQNDTLRPIDFTGLPHNQSYNQDFAGFFIDSSPWRQLTLHANLIRGGGINFTPPTGQLPVLGDETIVNAFMTIRPANALTIDNTYLFDRLDSRQAKASIFNSHIVRSKWNYQFTRELSLRLIAQYNAVLSNPSFSSLDRAKRFNADFLITYLLHPGTAIYVGYNSDLQNYDRSLCARLSNSQCDPNGVGLIRDPHGFINDGRLFFVKVSYLFRP